ncbi:unnamed protein product [Caenorhabditis auriculariae]|uniref:Uncharacterized protein n=1 Tax=Caenorhabditis auriculariae TaxID=2777116 RepID=A0A8S1H204_9PELO|nr:unnamed protein product [Caenorhabditis auriculariae]
MSKPSNESPGPSYRIPRDFHGLQKALINRTRYLNLVWAMAIICSFAALVDVVLIVFAGFMFAWELTIWRMGHFIVSLIYDGFLTVLVGFAFFSTHDGISHLLLYGFAVFSTMRTISFSLFSYSDFSKCDAFPDSLNCFSDLQRYMIIADLTVAITSLICCLLAGNSLLIFTPVVKVVRDDKSNQRNLGKEILNYRKPAEYTGYVVDGKGPAAPPGTSVAALVSSKQMTTAVVTENADVVTLTENSTAFGTAVKMPDGKIVTRKFDVDKKLDKNVVMAVDCNPAKTQVSSSVSASASKKKK